MKKVFKLDKANGKWMGVCAGLANYTGVDATFVRVAAVLVTLLGAFPWTLIAYVAAGLLGAFPWTLIAYVAAGLLAKPKRHRSIDELEAATPRLSTYEVRTQMRDIDRRMAEVESYVTSQNANLAREIEELR